MRPGQVRPGNQEHDRLDHPVHREASMRPGQVRPGNETPVEVERRDLSVLQ